MLDRGRRNKVHTLLRNLSSRGREKFQRPAEFFDNEQLPEECAAALAQCAPLPSLNPHPCQNLQLWF